jgi:Flp pilus assembly protein TadD
VVSVPFRLQLEAFHDPAGAASPAASDDTSPRASGAAEQKEVLKVFRQAARVEPTDPDYHYILGLGFARAGRHLEAAAAFQEAVSLNREDPEYRFAHGAALWELHRDDDAAAAFREALRLRPGDVATLNGLACALTRLRREPEAVALLHDAIRQGGPRADLYGNLAIALWQHARSADAFRAFRKAVSLDPASFVLRHNLGLALAAAARPAEAVDAFRHALRLRNNDASAHLDLAETLFDAGRLDEAGKALDTALQIDPAAMMSRPRSQEIRGAMFSRKLKEDLGADARPTSFWRTLGRLSSVSTRKPARGLNLALLAAVAAAYIAYRVLPPYATRFLLEDDIAQIAGAPVHADADIHDRLRHALKERGVDTRVIGEGCQVETRPKWRRIVCRYDVPVEPLPGLRYTLRVNIDKERPYLLPAETIQIGP